MKRLTMRRKTKLWILIIVISLCCIHSATFAIDSRLISESKQPLFVIIALPFIKDGGSAIYYGLGYQVIRWYKEESYKGLIGYEIHRIPYFKAFDKGPEPNLKYVDYSPHK